MNLAENNTLMSYQSIFTQGIETESIYDSIPIGLCILDRNLRYVRINQSLAEINGTSIVDHIGRTLSEMVPDLGEQAEKTIRKVIDTGEVLKLIVEFETPAKPGIKRFYETYWTPLKNTNNEIIGISVAVSDITDRNNALLSLQKMNDFKTQFLSILSHELRNPLASISLALSLANCSNEKLDHSLEVIRRQTNHLSHLVDDLLDVTRISRGITQLEKECVDITKLVLQCAADNQEQFSRKGITFIIECNPEPLYMNVDPTRLSQVIGNLLHNSLKFTSKGDTVKIIVTKDPIKAELLIIVSDTGNGIPKELLSDIFDPFVQADESLAQANGGLGLGLAVVRGMVELHDGIVTVESDGLFKGSTFTIHLPLSCEIDDYINPCDIVSKEDIKKPLRILVIEDNPDLSEIICELLEVMDHEVICAFNGETGIVKAKEFHPDVILCDIGLPGISGYEVAERVGCDQDLKNIYMIALSGYAQQQDIEKSSQAGFRCHIAKPVQFDMLKRSLAEAACAEAHNDASI